MNTEYLLYGIVIIAAIFLVTAAVKSGKSNDRGSSDSRDEK